MDIRHATHRGKLEINGTEIACAVLEDGTRIISQTSMFTAFNRPRKGEVRQEGLPSILGAKNLLPFISPEIYTKSKTIPYYHTNGKVAVGYNAELIPLICEVYLKAKDHGNVLTQSQAKIVAQCEILVRALAKTGINALVDEATGYQYDREKDALQKMLSLYIREDYLKWQARFPRNFYQEAFRLLNWKYDPSSVKRPGYLGKFTNTYVYELMPPNVLETLQQKNPVNENGNRVRRHHQYLTEDIGIPHLEKHITKLITIMELSDNMISFQKNFNRVFKKNIQVSFEDELFEESS